MLIFGTEKAGEASRRILAEPLFYGGQVGKGQVTGPVFFVDALLGKLLECFLDVLRLSLEEKLAAVIVGVKMLYRVLLRGYQVYIFK